MPNKPYYRVAVTHLEKFRRFLAGTSSFDTEQDVIDALAGVFIGTDKTHIGNAFHEILEAPEKYGKIEWGEEEYVMVPIPTVRDAVGKAVSLIGLPLESLRPVYQYIRAHSRMFHEIPVGKMYHTRAGVGLYVSGRCDGMEGAKVRDTKFKFRAVSDDEDYTDSAQWRLYLDMTQARSFAYDIFQVVGYESWPAAVNISPNPDKSLREAILLPGLSLNPYPTIECHSYEAMSSDIDTLLYDFVDWVKFRGLFHLLKPCDERGFYLRPGSVPAP